MCKDCAKSDLSLLEPVFAEFEGDSHALVTILQRAQEIYGYLPTDVIYRIAERQGVSPAKVLGRPRRSWGSPRSPRSSA